MTKDEVQDFAEVIRGYDAWRRNKVDQLQSSDYHLSASHYLDELANKRNADVIDELVALMEGDEGFDLTMPQLVTRIREVLGLA